MLKPFFIFTAIFISTILFSCSSPEDKRLHSEGDKVYEDFKEFVALTEEYAESENDIELIDTTIALTEVEALKTEYASYERRIDKNNEHFTPHQREVLMDLRDRFNIALKKKQLKFEDASKRYRMRQQLLGVEVKSDSMAEITPDNIEAAYQNFVTSVSQEMGTYNDQDWQAVEGFWRGLNNRKRQLKGRLYPADTIAIAKHQEKYLSLQKKDI